MADFWQAVSLVISREGGLVQDPADPGGITKYGISKRSYPDLDIAGLTEPQAKQIYHQDFWKWDNYPDQVVANKLLDMSVNLGLVTTIQMVQKIADVKQDGTWGPVTDNACLRVPDLIGRLREAHVMHYVNLILGNPAFQKYSAGWFYRAVQ